MGRQKNYIDFKKCYDFHIEVEFKKGHNQGQEGCLVKYRFDLHSNPYGSESEIKKTCINVEKYYSERQEFLKFLLSKYKGKECLVRKSQVLNLV